MAYSRASVPELENLLKYGKKKFVRYEEGAKLYSMGLHSFQELAKEANAVYHVKRIVLVNTDDRCLHGELQGLMSTDREAVCSALRFLKKGY